MKNLKKIAALVIVLAMALSTVAFGAVYSDVAADASYNEAVEVMSALGLLKGYEDGTFGPDKTITRAEFAAVIVRALGMEDAAAGAAVNTIFTDVTAAHWGAGYVQVANQQGIIAGYGDGTFGPDDEVTYEQAVKMIVCALGYDKMFENVANAYPAGYISQANKLGITVGAIGRIGDKASRATVARLVYNALDVKLMEQTTFGTDNYWSDVEDTLLSKNLKVAKVEANITAQYFDKDRLNKVYLNVTDGKAIYAYEASNGVNTSCTTEFTGDIEYAGATEIQKGYACVAYIDISGDKTDRKIISIVPKTGLNHTITLTGKQTKGGVLGSTDATYYVNDAETDVSAKKIQLDSLQAYVNKDSAQTAITTGWNTGAYTTITLIDNDNDNKYEYAYASQYSAAIVDKIYARTNRIDFKEGVISRLVLDPEDTAKTFIIKDAEGNELDFADIKEGDTLNIVTSTDGSANTLTEVTVTNNKVEGAVSEVISANEIAIGSDEYLLGTTATSAVGSLVSGDAGVFTVDMYGKVIDFELNGGNRNFGMVYAIYPDASGVESEAKAMIYTAAGEYVTYDFANNVKVNGTAYAKENLIAVNGAGTADDTIQNISTAKQLVMFTVNSANQINEIYYGAGIAARDAKYAISTSTTAQYKASTDKIGSDFIVDSSVLVANKAAAGITKKSDLSLTSKAVFDEDAATPYTYDAIVDNDKNIVIAVVYNATAKVDKASMPMYVTTIGSSVDSDGNTVATVGGYVDGEYTVIKVDYAATNVYAFAYKTGATTYAPTFTANTYTIAKGDVIQFIGEGEVADAVRVIASYADYKDGSIANAGSAAQDDDVEGFIYMAKVADIERNRTIKFVGGTDVDFNAGVIANLVQPATGWVVGTPTAYNRAFAATYSFADAETDANYVTANDDYVLVYLFDDEAKAAVILDTAADFK